MIYYNLNTINDWNFGDDNIIKVYKHGAVVFYKFDSELGGLKLVKLTQAEYNALSPNYDNNTLYVING